MAASEWLTVRRCLAAELPTPATDVTPEAQNRSGSNAPSAGKRPGIRRPPVH